MPYILDTRFFVIMRDYYPDTFPSFWIELENAIKSRKISSVDEVRREIEKYGGEQKHLLEWIKQHKHIFTQPDLREQQYVGKIFKTSNFQSLMSKTKSLKGGAFADPFVIAKAMNVRGTVVTGEQPANRNTKGKIQGSPKIPDVCQHFHVSCISPEEFMVAQQWKF